MWYQELELANMRGGYVPHQQGFGSVWESTQNRADLADYRITWYKQQAAACSSKTGRVVKTIRMNGHLDSVFNASHAMGLPPPLVLHLVRNPKSVYTSRKGLTTAPFGLPTLLGKRENQATVLQTWARTMCFATRHDMLVGRKHSRYYFFLNFSEFVRRPLPVVEKLYARYFKRQVPVEVATFVREHVQPDPRRHVQANESSWQYQFGTKARNLDQVEHRWRQLLQPWEVQAIDSGCGKLSYKFS